MSAPATASFSEFARLAGFKPGYVTQLKRDDRLVLTDDGKAVRVVESMERIKATRDPARGDVAARHAAARPPQEAPPNSSAVDLDDDLDPTVITPYQQARATKEHYLALKEKRDYEQSMGKLMDADEVTSVVADAVTSLRTRMESIPDVYAAQLAAESGEAGVRAILADAIQHALEETARQFGKLGKEAGA